MTTTDPEAIPPWLDRKLSPEQRADAWECYLASNFRSTPQQKTAGAEPAASQ
jgi:hypothetical protein